MREFHLYNTEIFNKYILYRDSYNLSDISLPLLVSPNLLKEKNKILYIGQETNTWGKHHSQDITVEVLENIYDQFLKMGPPNTIYWKFIRDLFETDNLYQNLVWSNLLLCGKKDTLGTPKLPDEFISLSSEYLFQLYQTMLPSKVIITSSPKYPYINVITSFLEKCGVDIINGPSKNFPVVFDSSLQIFWTYHPKYLRLSKKSINVTKEIKKYI